MSNPEFCAEIEGTPAIYAEIDPQPEFACDLDPAAEFDATLVAIVTSAGGSVGSSWNSLEW